MAKARPQLDKMANGKKKPMSRTSGVARRLTKRDEGIATKLKYGAPLTGSASGVKSISLKDAGEVLTSGIVTLGKKGLQADPASLAMALPVGKVLKAAQALRAAGKATQAASISNRLVAKSLGRDASRLISKNKGAKNPYISENLIGNAKKVREISTESVFPRAPKKGALGDLEAGALPGSNMTNVQARRFAASRAADRAGNYTPVRELEKRLKLPKGRGK